MRSTKTHGDEEDEDEKGEVEEEQTEQGGKLAGATSLRNCEDDVAWQGHPVSVLYHNLHRYSATFRAFEGDWARRWWGVNNSHASLRMVPRTISQRVTNELNEAVVKAVLRHRTWKPNMTLSDVVVREATCSRWNWFHICSLQRAATILQV